MWSERTRASVSGWRLNSTNVVQSRLVVVSTPPISNRIAIDNTWFRLIFCPSTSAWISVEIISWPRLAARSSYSASKNSRVFRELRSEEHTSELQSLMRISYAVFCLTKNKHTTINTHEINTQ